MQDINSKTHAKLSPSSSARWLSCPASVLMEEGFEDTSSQSAEEGTLAHALCELKLKAYFYPGEMTKRRYNAAVKKLKQDPLWADEMEGYTDTYRDYIRQVSMSIPGVTPYVAIEKRLDMTDFVPGCFGTGDCVMILGDELHIVDFKYGKSPDGRVDAVGNTQMQLYALGAYRAYSALYKFQKVVMHIVQPRLTDGITSWTISVKDLLDFGIYARERAKLTEDETIDPVPSEKACRYCKAGAICRKRAEVNLEMADRTRTDPRLMTPEEIGLSLKKGVDVDKWLKRIQSYALSECLAGKEIPGWKAVEGRGAREWTDGEKAFKTLIDSGVNEAMLYVRTPLTLAQTETAVGKKFFAEKVGEYVVKKPGKPALVEESDKRPAITNELKAADVFGKA